MKKMRMPICEKLTDLKQEGRIPFHMPGHKRKNIDFFANMTSMDITEITGYDNLHHPEGMIAESMEQLRQVYHTKKSWYLVNGSTVGILSSISAVCRPGDQIMVARNCHKAVYNAIRLLHLRPVYLYPSYSENYDMMQGVMKEEIEWIENKLEENPGIKAVLITSPTYEGVVSDVAALKKVTSCYGIPLIVDEAHGAHFTFHDYFPKSAVDCGADIVIQSAHKTLPSFTQTALLHLCSDLVSEKVIEEMLSIYQTSSPSYLLMASAEYGVFYTQNHAEKVQEYVDNLIDFRRKCAQFKHISLLEADQVKGYDYDRGKLVFLVKQANLDGKKLFDSLLEKFHIELEMETAFYCIAMTSLMDGKEDFSRLFDALVQIDQKFGQKLEYEFNQGIDLEYGRECDQDEAKEIAKREAHIFSIHPSVEMLSSEAVYVDKVTMELDHCAGKIAGEYVYLYPPGIPILVPGEKIEQEIVENIRYYLYNGYNVPSVDDGMIQVLNLSEEQ